MQVLSLFDGMSCGQIALNRIGITPAKYYAAEIDKHAIEVTKDNYPNTIHLGDVTKWHEWSIDWASIDLIIGGSPCQGFSFAGKQLAFDDPRSKLFFVFLDILSYIKMVNPKVKFMLENVKMKKDYLAVISEKLGVEPVFINSALVSAQNRQRFYWCNWSVSQPGDKGVAAVDILEDGGAAIAAQRGRYVINGVRQDGRGKTAGLTRQYIEFRYDLKSNALTTVQKDNLVVSEVLAERVDLALCLEVGRFDARRPSGQEFKVSKKANCLCSSYHKGIDSHGQRPAVSGDGGVTYRKLTPIECERLQTVPDNYTDAVSNTQRYRMLGNGWTVDVIAHIFRAGLL